MREVLKEVFMVMQTNRSRLMLTGFSIGWGLFILIVMLGSGNGITRGIRNSFGSDTVCTVYLNPGTTSMASNGFSPQREIRLHDADAADLRKTFSKDISKIMLKNSSGSISLAAGTHRINTTMTGCETGNLQYDFMKIVEGRDITSLDIRRHSKVCLIGKQSQDILYKTDTRNPADTLTKAVGKTVFADGVALKVVGVYDSSSDFGSGHTVYIPYTTGMDIYAQDGSLSQILIVADKVRNQEQLDAFKSKIYNHLAKRLSFNPNDKLALSCTSYTDQYFQFNNILTMMKIFIWIVGLATLLSGVVGVSNIMIIGIRERTREFGVRISMGASDASIISLVMIESVMVTLIFGYIGLTCGILLTQAMAWGLTAIGGISFFSNPTIDFNVLLISLGIMLIAGIIAGFVPARQAVRMKLVDALNG